MSDKSFEGTDKMSVDVVNEAESMADYIVRTAHRGPGDTIEAAIHRAERHWGAPANWLHRLRYRARDLRDLPASAFLQLQRAYHRAAEAGERAYLHERALADARNSKLVGLADLVAGQKAAETKE